MLNELGGGYNDTDVETKAYAAYSLDEGQRLENSSGGIFSELAINVLNSGGVVYGAAYNKDFSVRHICIDSIDKLALLRSSKYAQSFLGNCFKDIKKGLTVVKMYYFQVLHVK